MSAWTPIDDELDGLARGLPRHEPSAERAEHNRTSVLAGAATLRQQSPGHPWRSVATVALPLAAAAAIAIWLGFRPSEPHKVSITDDGARYSIVSELPEQLVRLDDGTLTVAVEALEAERFRIQAPDGELTTTGARFVVAVQREHVSSVTVSNGTVELRVTGAPPVFLSSGQVWTRTLTAQRDVLIDAKPGPVVPPIVPPPASAKPDPRITVANSTRPSTTADPTRTQPTVPSPATRPRSTSPAGTRAATPPTARPPTATPPATPPLATPSVPTPSVTTPSVATPSVATPPATVTPTQPALPGEAEFRAGMAALRTGDPSGATKAFTIACATRAALAEDACFWVGAAARRAAQTSAARDALDSFLRRFPSSARAGEAAALLGWILFEAGDLDGADRRFHQAAADRVPRVRDSATKGLTAVERKRH